jgi:hypothetical protein
MQIKRSEAPRRPARSARRPQGVRSEERCREDERGDALVRGRQPDRHDREQRRHAEPELQRNQPQQDIGAAPGSAACF